LSGRLMVIRAMPSLSSKRRVVGMRSRQELGVRS
jgi:hypothetical protein